MNKADLTVLEQMIDFTQLKDKTDEEIASWARDRWALMMERELWTHNEAQPYVATFSRYMKVYAPDLFVGSGKSD
jgi:hypothetical protein